jgi:hypothetical protein
MLRVRLHRLVSGRWTTVYLSFFAQLANFVVQHFFVQILRCNYGCIQSCVHVVRVAMWCKEICDTFASWIKGMGLKKVAKPLTCKGLPFQ